MKTRLFLIAMLLSGCCWAQCTQPTILPSLASPSVTVTTNSPSDGDVTLTYDTDVASDTAGFIALSGGGTPDQYDYPKGSGYWWDTSGATDLTGVTHHVAVVHGVPPGTTFAYNVRSRCVSGGAPVLDQSHLRFAYEYDTGQTSGWSPTVTMPALITTDPANFWLVTSGGSTIYNGYSGFLRFGASQLAGTDTSLKVTFSGFPACTTHQYVGYTGQYASSDSITVSPSVLWHGFNIRLTTSGCTPGTYTIHAAFQGVQSGWTGSLDYVVTVANLPTFTFGNPSSYPTIPCWQHGSKMTDGTTACTQTFDDTLITTEAAYWAGNVLVGGIFGGCGTTSPAFAISSNGDQWPEYYDGARVFNQMADYVSKYPGSTTNPLSLYTTAAQACGNAYYTSASTIGYNQIPGRWLFGEGAYQNYTRYGLAAAGTFLTNEDTQAAYVPQGVNWQYSYTWEYQDDSNLREITYACNWELWIHKFNGKNTSTQLQWCTDMLLGYVDQIINRGGTLEQGFFDGLLADTLIEIYSDPYTGADPRIPVVLQLLATHMSDPVQHVWQAYPSTQTNSFCLNCRKTDIGLYGGDNSMLNMMAVQLFGWLWKNTGTTSYQTFGDNAFQYGILGYGRYHGKELSENMRMLPQYIYDRTNPSSSIPASIRFSKGARVRGGGSVIIR